MLYVVGPVSQDFKTYFLHHNIPYCRFATHRKDGLLTNEFPIDFSDAESIVRSLQLLTGIDKPTAILVTGYEQYVWRAAIIAQYFGVLFCTPSAALKATDKFLMRRAFKAHDPAITPSFEAVETLGAALAFADTYGYPVMLKPANLMKSMLISKSDTAEQLTKNYNDMADNIGRLYDKYTIHEPPKIIVEQFMEGSMHTVAGFVDQTGAVLFSPGIADCTTAQQIGVDDNYLFSRTLPTSTPAAAQTALLSVAESAVKALDLTSCPVHVELIVTPSGPKVIEVGARLGGYRPRMYAQAYGDDFYAAALDLAYGRTPHVTTDSTNAIAVVELFPAKTGAFVRIDSGFANIVQKFEPGSIIGPAHEGYRAAGVAIVTGTNRDELITPLDELCRSEVVVKS